MSETILKVTNVSKRFGGLQALSDVGIEIQRGQVYGLIGPNAARVVRHANCSVLVVRP